jgi:hypothetical protein
MRNDRQSKKVCSVRIKFNKITPKKRAGEDKNATNTAPNDGL